MTPPVISMLHGCLRRASGQLRVHARALLLQAADEPEHLRLLRCGHPWRRTRMLAAVVSGCLAVAGLGMGGLYWRLNEGPVSLRLVTPWLTAALQERFGAQHQVEVGDTVLERDQDGHAALRLLDIVVRDSSGTVVASAPKAEVGIVGSSLMAGRVRPESFRLIGATMAVRIERDGQLNIFAAPAALAGAPATSGDQPSADPIESGTPFRTVQAPAAVVATHGPGEPEAEPSLLATAVGWLQNLDDAGFDGEQLIEIGLESGRLIVDDRRSGKKVSFSNIDMSLTRQKQGGAALAVKSMGADGPWSLQATVTPRPDGVRVVEAMLRDISPKDIALAMRLGDGLQTDIPLSGVFMAEVGSDGVPLRVEGRVIAGAGNIATSQDPASRVLIDEATMQLRWDPSTRKLQAPIDIQAGPNLIKLVSEIEPPQGPDGVWRFSVPQGAIRLASLERPKELPLLLDHVSLQAQYDPATSLLSLEKGYVRGPGGGVSLSGSVDLSGDDPRVQIGVAGGRMSVPALKRLWPAGLVPPVRAWVDRHFISGSVEKLAISANAKWSALKPKGAPLRADELAIEIVTKGNVVSPVDGLPPVRDTDVVAKITGRAAMVTFGRGVVDMPSGRKLVVAGGSFEVPETQVGVAPAATKFRMEGALDAVAELMSMPPVRDTAGIPFDASTLKGNATADVAMSIPMQPKGPQDVMTYAVDAEVAGFVGERFVRGQKAEAQLLHVTASEGVLQVRGDVKIGGMPASIELRKAKGEPDAELRLTATLDEAARNRLGFDLGTALAGSVPVKVSGRVKLGERDARLAVEADLTQARINNLLPGWSKAAGRSARSAFVVTDRGTSTRLDDFSLEGAGVSVRGGIEIDSNGALVHANLPTYSVSDGDRASIRADRGSDGLLRVVVRGDLFDGRGFVKTAVAGERPEQRARRPAQDMDLDIKLGAVTGHHGEAMRGLDLKVVRRSGKIRSFAMSGKLGKDARISGDLRVRGAGRSVVYIETDDAGALFRFTDTYPRMVGGKMSVAMDPPTTDNAPQEGLLNISDFFIRGERALEQVASTTAVAEGSERGGYRRPTGDGVGFSAMRVEFTRSPGRLTIHDGVVWGPAIGATLDGALDYAHDEVRLRGTFVPAYALNNMFSRLPIVGMLLGGGANEGLLGVTYQVSGSPRAPVLAVNPISAVAPGFLRKLFEFRGADERTGTLPPNLQ